MGNPNLDRVAISLHVYSPPYNQCHIFDPERPLKQLVSIVTAYGVEHPFVEKKVHLPKPYSSNENAGDWILNKILLLILFNVVGRVEL
jgi:hypothetical protein